MVFLERQRALDREIRAPKRLYWFQQQQDLIEMKNSPDFWKTIGRVGISQLQVHKIPWEVVNEDQTISIDHRTVLKRWKTAFEQLLNPDPSAVDIIPETMHGVYPVIGDTTMLNK